MRVAVERIGPGGDLGELRRYGWARFAAAVRRELVRWGGQRVSWRVVRGVYDAATDPVRAAVGVAGQWPGALERVGFALADLHRLTGALADIEARMLAVLDELHLQPAGRNHPRGVRGRGRRDPRRSRRPHPLRHGQGPG